MEDSRDQRVNMTRGGMPFLILLVSALLLAVGRLSPPIQRSSWSSPMSGTSRCAA